MKIITPMSMGSEMGNFSSLCFIFRLFLSRKVCGGAVRNCSCILQAGQINTSELFVPISDVNLLLFLYLHLLYHCHTSSVLSGFVSPAQPSPCILYFSKRNYSAQISWRLSRANSPFAAKRTWGWWNPSPYLPLQQQKCPTQVLKLLWSTGCWLLFPLSLFFKEWTLYLYCLRERTGLQKNLHSSRMLNCYG